MKTGNKNIWKIIRTKKDERSILEQAILDDWLWKWFVTPIRIIIFPIMLLVKLYKWTYDMEEESR